MTFLNGYPGWVLMRNRGRIRSASASWYSERLRGLHEAFLRGEWSPRDDSPVTSCAISLTSWRPRLESLPLILLSLLNQSVRPAAIHVWLTPVDLALVSPQVYGRYADHGVRFESCGDLGPHKKWLPMIERGATEPFVICDDDIIYPREWFENLIAERREDAYVGERCHRLRYDDSGLPLPYAEWDHDVFHESSPSHDLMITGCGGAIIHPDRITDEFRDRPTILKKCPRADDIWLKAAHAAAGIPCYKTRYCFPCLEIPGTITTSLLKSNVDSGGNDSQILFVQDLLRKTG